MYRAFISKSVLNLHKFNDLTRTGEKVFEDWVSDGNLGLSICSSMIDNLDV